MRKLDNFIKEHIAKLLIGGIVYALLFIAYQSIFIIPTMQASITNIEKDKSDTKSEIKELRKESKEIKEMVFFIKGMLEK